MRGLRCLLYVLPLFVLMCIPSEGLLAQCPQVFDYNGNATTDPNWYACGGGDYTLNLQSPDDWVDYEIDWGDGSPLETGAPWTSPDAISHLYPEAVDTYTITITEVATGCVITGTFVQEEATSASIQIPVGGLTQACAPQEMEFINSSTNVSENTVFTWDFGDGSPQLTFDHTNWGQTIAHTYLPNTVDCETEVTLTAENQCNTIQGGPSEATFSPIRIWDIDDAAITADATVLCYPDTTVTLSNTTERNCLFQGNIYQRYEYWNFGDYWGEGQDSIVDWTPWPPTFPHTIAYPGIGTYEVTLLDSNYCGIDTATITIEIVPPPTADITASEDTICVGEPITFFQNASGGASSFSWNFDDGIGWIPTGGGNITYVFNNPGTYNVCNAVSIPSSSSACADTACVDVVVLPSPTAVIGNDGLTGCDNLTVTYEDQSIGALNSTWTFDVDPFSFDGTNPPPVDYPGAGTYVTTLTVEGLNGCLDTEQAIVEVFNSPVVDFTATNVCQGTAGTFTDLSTSDPGDPIISWAWDFGDGDTGSGQSIEHTYDAIGSYDVVLVVSTATCSASITMTVEVEPAPIADIAASPMNGCSPLDVAFQNNSSGADNYTWQFGDGGGSNDEEPVYTYYNYTGTDTTYQVVLTAYTAFGCGASDTLEITVNPGAQASFTDNSNPPSCAPYDATFINTSQGAISYYWEFGDGDWSNEVNPTHLYENETGFLQTFTVSLIAYAANGCNDTTYSNITVYPTPNFEFELNPDSACSPLVVTMPFIQGINSYEWDFGDGSPVSTYPTPTHIFENTGTDPVNYTVQLIGVSAFGCVDTTYNDVWVDPQPQAQFNADVTSGCSALTVNFENTSYLSDSYYWDYGDGQSSSTGAINHSHTFINTGTETVVYNVELTAISDDGCTDTFTVPIQVFPEAVASFADPGSACSPFTTTFENTSQNGNSYFWDFGNGFTSTNSEPTTTFMAPDAHDTTYTVTLEITSLQGCVSSYSQDIYVASSPVASFTLSQDEGCHPAPADITNNSVMADSFVWDYGDGFTSTENAPVHSHEWSSTSANPVEYVVTLVAISSSGCTDTTSLPYTVYPQVVAEFIGLEEGCSPLQVNFSNQSLGANGGFQWDFGDGQTSSQTNPNHIFVNNGTQDTTYQVTMVAESIYGCTDTIDHPVTVFATPIANALIDTTMGCYPLEVVFENASIGGGSYEWVYGTGETSNTDEQFHTYTYYNFDDEPVTYNVTLNITSPSGCNSSDALTVDVLPLLDADFTAINQGCSPLTIDFNNESSGALSYYWEFGDGETHTIANPQHTFYNETTEDVVYEVMLVAQSYYGCFDTTYMDVTVFATPFASFIATPESQTWPDATVELENNSIAGDVNYTWDMGDGTVLSGENPGPYTYGSWGVYTIELEISNGFCSDVVTQSIEILAPEPIANFEGPASGCGPLTVAFTDMSEYAASYYWNFGDGGVATIPNPVYTYYQPGTYTVTLTVQGFNPGDSDTMVREEIIEVYPNAVAAFTVAPSQVMVPGEPMYAINLSQNAATYEWNFGDGGSSTDENPVYVYQDPGFYSIELIANNEWNCPDTTLLVDIVEGIATGEIEFPNAFTPNTSGSNGGLYDPTSYNNDVFFPIHNGVEEFQLQIFNRWGELLFESTEVGIGWDGYYKNELCKQDVYAWKAKVRFVNGEEVIQAGDVTLLIR